MSNQDTHDIKDTEHRIPNNAFDMEYATQRRSEYLFLKANSIIPSFVKVDKRYNVRTYKYTKTPELFEKVAEFYRQDAIVKPEAYEKAKKISLTDAVANLINLLNRYTRPEGDQPNHTASGDAT